VIIAKRRRTNGEWEYYERYQIKTTMSFLRVSWLKKTWVSVWVTMMAGYSANHALITCSISTKPLGEPASGRVKSLICMGMAECSFRPIMRERQRGVRTHAAMAEARPPGTRACAQPWGSVLLAVSAALACQIDRWSPVAASSAPLRGSWSGGLIGGSMRLQGASAS
jgi:hypothetical protein